MSTQQQRLQDLATRLSSECKSIRTLLNGNGPDLTSLTTAQKGNLVAAVNELRAAVTAFQQAGYTSVNDASLSSAQQTYSIDKIKAEIASTAAATKNAILNGAGAAYDTLKELQDLLVGEQSAIDAINTALGNRVRVDTAAQGLTTLQKQNARANINAYGSDELGNPDTDLVAVFNQGLI